MAPAVALQPAMAHGRRRQGAQRFDPAAHGTSAHRNLSAAAAVPALRRLVRASAPAERNRALSAHALLVGARIDAAGLPHAGGSTAFGICRESCAFGRTKPEIWGAAAMQQV